MSRSDDRAVSEVIGAVILFGFLVITFTIYQGVVIPQQNKAVEFNHNEAVQDSIQDLRNAIRQTSTTAAEESVSIKLGATYPERVIAVNPGVSAGSIRTESLGNVSISNVSGTDGEVRDYFGASTTTLGPFETKALVYHPIYFQYTTAPDTAYENTVAYNTFQNGVNLSITDQAVVDGRKITLVTLSGNVSTAQQGTVSIDTQAVSTAISSVTMNDSGGPINITLATRLSAANWTDLLEDELDPDGTDPDRYVSAVRQTGPNQVSIILEPGVDYELKLAKVGVGEESKEAAPKYVVDVGGDGTSVVENGTQQLVVEVRDRFNNPVSNVTVSASFVQRANESDGAEAVSPGTMTTDADGEATFTYAAPHQVDGAQEANLDVTFNGGNNANETVQFDIRVLDADGSGSRSLGRVQNVNPAGSGTVVLSGQSAGDTSSVTITLQNLTADPGVEITAARISFYFDNDVGMAGPNAPPTEADIYSSAQGIGSGQATTLAFGDVFVALNTQIPLNPTPGDSSDTTDINLDFDSTVAQNDFYVLSLKLSNGDTYTYFIAHR